MTAPVTVFDLIKAEAEQISIEPAAEVEPIGAGTRITSVIFTVYFLSTHNPDLKLDLPLYLRFDTASAGVTLIKSLSHALSTWKGVLENFLGDSAHDNYATYTLLRHWSVKPFIDLNSRGKDTPKPQKLVLSKRGIPICADGHEMTNWGFEAKKFRVKYRCPLKTGKVKSCPYAEQDALRQNRLCPPFAPADARPA